MAAVRSRRRDIETAQMIAAATVGGDAESWLREYAARAAQAGILAERNRVRGNGAPDACIVVLDLNGDEVRRFAVRKNANDVAEEVALGLSAVGYVQCVTCRMFLMASDCDCIDYEESEWCCKPCNTPRPPCDTTNLAPANP